ncbi:hypothetical protein GALMADRAFT_206226 [Galerina marginata CBS 339.88]|uniref:Uncharacterized protein n=1 Tax=Galerina marginata (strain CBS 339.88) TaxID=685588 RepID=A0A067TGG8_GALM3|nr:hypothetical protein GALMADRAFT_206226 [Galerina marginata CBS 339.88]
MSAHPHPYATALAQKRSRTDENQNRNIDASATTSINNSTTAMGESTNANTMCVPTTATNVSGGINTDPPKKLSPFHFTPVPFRPRSPSQSTSTGPPPIVHTNGDPLPVRYRRKPRKSKRPPRTYTVEELQEARLLRNERAKVRKEEKERQERERERERQERERLHHMEAARLSNALHDAEGENVGYHALNGFFDALVRLADCKTSTVVNTEIASFNWEAQPSPVSFLRHSQSDEHWPERCD